MTAQIIDGKALAKKLRKDYLRRSEALQSAGVKPGLAVILVGDNPSSRVYVGNKVKACTECGVHSTKFIFREDIAEVEILNTIQRLRKH